MSAGFSDAQKLFLDGLGRGLAAARAGAAHAATPDQGPDAAQRRAQARAVSAGGALTREEEAKRDRHPFDIWDEMVARAQAAEFPKGLDVFRYKFHGLFHVAPAQDSFMCRLRIPNGILDAHRFAAVADLAERYAGGYAHVTTRANLQLREIGARHAIDLLQGLAEAGLTSRGAGADNVRNITGSPTAGIDPLELVDTRPLGLALHHAILNHRELYGLPRKFNVAFDGGGSVGALEDTNDIGFSAVRVGAGRAVPAGVHFRVGVGGITGHGDFTTDLGIAIAPTQCVAVALAILGVFQDEGDRTDRKRARLKYVLARMGAPAFLAAVEARLGAALPRLAPGDCEPRAPLVRGAHAGFHAERDAGRAYAGVALPAGRMSVAQMRALADLAVRRGAGELRLTVWQNVIVAGLRADDADDVERELLAMGLTARPSPIRAGVVACTGNTGCKFAASDTKRHALAIVEHVERTVALDTPLNVHVTGCPHSCAQHYVGDIGLLGARIPAGDDDTIEGYHVVAGGGFGDARGLAREIARDVAATDVPALVARLVAAYLAHRRDPQESFAVFARRHSPEALHAYAQSAAHAAEPSSP
jgi:ferredoxin-nitrite reductase